MLRTQAAFHSAFVMCVPRSQKPMQSASVLPPPPGALGAVSLGLPDELPGDKARLGRTTLEVANCSGNCGESGATGASWGIGSPIAEGGVAATAGAGGAALIIVLESIVCASDDAVAGVFAVPVLIGGGVCTPRAGGMVGVARAGWAALAAAGVASVRGIAVTSADGAGA